MRRSEVPGARLPVFLLAAHASGIRRQARRGVGAQCCRRVCARATGASANGAVRTLRGKAPERAALRVFGGVSPIFREFGDNFLRCLLVHRMRAATRLLPCGLGHIHGVPCAYGSEGLFVLEFHCGVVLVCATLLFILVFDGIALA